MGQPGISGMKQLLIFFLLFCGSITLAQDTYRTQAGQIQFDASTPLEDIFAVNDQVNAAVKDNGEIAVLLLVEEFEFKRKLMQEHFNENYIESEKYPKAYFAGIVASFDTDSLSGEPRIFELNGDLTLHGVTRPITTELHISREGESISIRTEFTIRTEDYGIRVPRLLFKKIAEEIQVQVTASLDKT
jgi:hypothetical protein